MRYSNLTLAFLAITASAASTADIGQPPASPTLVKQPKEDTYSPEGKETSPISTSLVPGLTLFSSENIGAEKGDPGATMASRESPAFEKKLRDMAASDPSPPNEKNKGDSADTVPFLSNFRDENSRSLDSEVETLEPIIRDGLTHDPSRPKAPSVVSKHANIELFASPEDDSNLDDDPSEDSTDESDKDEKDSAFSGITAMDVSDRLAALGLGSDPAGFKLPNGEAVRFGSPLEDDDWDSSSYKIGLLSNRFRESFNDQLIGNRARAHDQLGDILATSDAHKELFGVPEEDSKKVGSSHFSSKTLRGEGILSRSDASGPMISAASPFSDVPLSKTSMKSDTSGESNPLDPVKVSSTDPATSDDLQNSREDNAAESKIAVNDMEASAASSASANASSTVAPTGADTNTGMPLVTSFDTVFSLNISIGLSHVLTTTATVTLCELGSCRAIPTVTGVITRTSDNIAYVTFCPLPTQRSSMRNKASRADGVGSPEPLYNSIKAPHMGRALVMPIEKVSPSSRNALLATGEEESPELNADDISSPRAARSAIAPAFKLSEPTAHVLPQGTDKYNADLGRPVGYPPIHLSFHQSPRRDMNPRTGAGVIPSSSSKKASGRSSTPLITSFEGGSQPLRFGFGAVLLCVLALC